MRGLVFTIVVLALSRCLLAGELAEMITAARNRTRQELKNRGATMTAAERRALSAMEIDAAKEITTRFESDSRGEFDNEDLVSVAELYEKCFRFKDVLSTAERAISQYPGEARAKHLKFRALLNLKRLADAEKFLAAEEAGSSSHEEPIVNAHSLLAIHYLPLKNWEMIAVHSDKSLSQGLIQARTNPSRLRQCMIDIKTLSRSSKQEDADKCRGVLGKHLRRLHDEADVIMSAGEFPGIAEAESALHEIRFEIAVQLHDSSASAIAGVWVEREAERWRGALRSQDATKGVFTAVIAIRRHCAAIDDMEKVNQALEALHEVAVEKGNAGDQFGQKVAAMISSTQEILEGVRAAR